MFVSLGYFDEVLMNKIGACAGFVGIAFDGAKAAGALLVRDLLTN